MSRVVSWCGDASVAQARPSSGFVRRHARGCLDESGQMAVELAALIPVVVVVALVVFNLGRFVVLCASFDRVALRAVAMEGVAPSGEQSTLASVDEVRGAIVRDLGTSSCDVEVYAEDAGALALTRYRCVLAYRPWPSSFVLAGVLYDAPLVLTHERSLVVDRFRPGVVI